jgi:hypothetical protein
MFECLDPAYHIYTSLWLSPYKMDSSGRAKICQKIIGIPMMFRCCRNSLKILLVLLLQKFVQDVLLCKLALMLVDHFLMIIKK